MTDRLKNIVMHAKAPSVRLAASDITNQLSREQAQERYGRTVARVNNRKVVENIRCGTLVHTSYTYIRRTSREMKNLLPHDPSLEDLACMCEALKKLNESDSDGDYLEAPGVYVIVFHDQPEATKVGETKDLIQRIRSHASNNRRLTVHAYFHPVGETSEELESWSKEQLRSARIPGNALEMYAVEPQHAIDTLSQRGKQVFP